MAISFSKVAEFTEIPTYTTLQELVVEYLNRTDEATIDMVPLFISMAEKALLRNLRIPSMEVRTSFAWGDVTTEEGRAEGSMVIPKDYLEMQDIWTHDSGGNSVTFTRLPFSDLLRNTSTTAISAEPLTTEDTYREGFTDGKDFTRTGPYFARSGNRWFFRPFPAEDTEFHMVYYKDPLELKELEDNSLMLTIMPDAILYQSISEGFRFLYEEEKAEYYTMQAEAALTQIQRQADESEYSGHPLQIAFG